MNNIWLDFAWLIISLLLIALIHRKFHDSLLRLLSAFTFNPEASLILYVILLFPGIVLHEISHLLMAWVLGVRTTGFSLLPQISENGDALEFGYVEYTSLDDRGRNVGSLRRFLIGFAPSIFGFIVIALIASTLMSSSSSGPSGVPSNQSPPQAIVETGGFDSIPDAVLNLFTQNTLIEFLLLFYIIFTVVNTMFPSLQDIRTALAFLLILAVGMGFVVWNAASVLSSTEIQNLSIITSKISFASYLVVAFSLVLIVNTAIILLNAVIYNNQEKWLRSYQ
jgi:hypothetical protein